MNKYLQYIVVFLGFALVGGLIYSNSLSAQFILDSEDRIKNNQYLRISSLTPGSLSEAVFNEKSSKNRPIPSLSFALNYYFDQYNVKYYHVVNIFLHIITGFLLFLLYETLLGFAGPDHDTGHPPFAALAAALMWLVHPLHTQSVTYIVQRSNILAALFCIGSLLMYIHSRRSKRPVKKITVLATAVIFWLLALGCKQNAAVLPFIVLLCEWFFIQDMRRAWLKDNLKYFIGIFLLFGLIAFIYLGIDPIAKLNSMRDFSQARFTLSERILTQFRVVVYYISLFCFPHPSRLNLDYDFPLSHSLFDPVTTLLSALLLIGLIFAGILTARKHRLVSFCIFWYFLYLAIESSIIPLAIIFEHRTYMPFMGLTLLVVMSVDRYLKPLWLKIILIGAIVSVCSLWTYQRNTTWQDPVTLWQDVVNKSPSKARPYANLGWAFHNINKIDNAIANYKAALKIEPYHLETLINLGAALQDLNRIEEAVAYFKTALRVNPNQVEALANLGSALMDQGQTRQAEKYLRAALEIDPANTHALNNLGAAFENQGHPDEAARLFKAALKVDPDNVSALNHLGLVHIANSDISKALDLFKHALRLEPGNAETHVNLGAAYLKLEQFETAILHLKTALKLDPEMAQAHTNLGIALLQQGQFQNGFLHIKKAVELEPDDRDARVNLTRALDIKRQIDSNIVELRKAADADPQNPHVYANLANLYQSIGDRNAAIKALKRALEIEPGSDTLLNSLGNLYLASNQYGQALKVFERHLSLDPDFSLPYYNLARWHAKQNSTTEALMWLEKAIARGYANWPQVKSDPDLETIRGTDRYKTLLKGR